jgi:hypothetical protein
MSKILQNEQKESNTTLKVILKELATIQLVHKKTLRVSNYPIFLSFPALIIRNNRLRTKQPPNTPKPSKPSTKRI